MKKADLPKILFIVAAASAWACAQGTDSSQTQAKSDSIEALNKILVTASRTKRLLSETPASASIISKNTIASSPANSIEDLLITQTGVQAKRSAGIGEGIPSDIIIRGIPGALAASRTLILVDGVPTNVSGTPFLIVNEVPMDAIERIEMVRGPYSSLYGANAFGGVVNILTKEGAGPFRGTVTTESSYPFTIADQYFSEHSSIASALKKSGAVSLWGVNGTGSAGSDKAGCMFSAGYRTIGNYLLRDFSIVNEGDSIYHTKADNYDYTDFRLFGKANYYPSKDADITLNLRYFKSELGFGKTKYILPDSQDIITKGEKILVGPQAKVRFSDILTVHAGGFFRHVTGEFWGEGKDSSRNAVRTYWESQTNDWQAETQGFLNLNDNNTVTAGVELLRNGADFGATVDPATGRSVPNSFPVKRAIENSAGYIQDEWKPFPELSVVPVARVDYHSEFGAVFCPKLGLSYGPLAWLRMRASAGRSFRAPSLAELYLPDLQVNADFLLKANPNLRPEYIWGYDGGFDFLTRRNMTCKLGVFFNTMNNLISQTVVLDTLSNYVTHRNVTSATSEGIESEVQWKPLEWLTAGGHLTLENSNDETYHVPLDFVPDIMFGLTAAARHTYGTTLIEGQLFFNFVGSRSYLDFTHASLMFAPPDGSPVLVVNSKPLPQYGTLDLSCKATFSGGCWIALTAQNLLNTLYQEAAGTLAPGRLALIKIGYDF